METRRGRRGVLGVALLGGALFGALCGGALCGGLALGAELPMPKSPVVINVVDVGGAVVACVM